MSSKPRVAIHKFSSCDGCQLAFLNLGEALLTLDALVDVVHFAEAGPFDPDAEVDIAFVEGSVSTEEDLARIAQVRAHSRYLVTMGACATAGGVQALRNMAAAGQWLAEVYAKPAFIDSLDQVRPIKACVKVDLELWGCPVNSRQVLAATRSLLFGVSAVGESDSVCMACKREQAVCVMVAQGQPCLGAVTRSGCGAICPRFGRDCYGCYGPTERPNTEALGQRLAGLGLQPQDIAQRFHAINSQAEKFLLAGQRWSVHDD